MLRLVLLAGPGVDVVTQTGMLADQQNLTPVILRDVARDQIQARTVLGVQIDRLISRGDRVGDELLVDLFTEAITAANYRWVVSNFPATLAAAQLLDMRGLQPDLVVELAVSDQETAVRLRRTCTGCRTSLHVCFRPPRRPGLCDLCGAALDLPDQVVADRIAQANQQLRPVAAHYRAAQRFQRVDGTGNYQQIAAQITTLLPTSDHS